MKKNTFLTLLFISIILIIGCNDKISELPEDIVIDELDTVPDERNDSIYVYTYTANRASESSILLEGHFNGTDSIISKGFLWGSMETNSNLFDTLYSLDTAIIFQALLTNLDTGVYYQYRAFVITMDSIILGEIRNAKTCSDSTCFEYIRAYKPNIYIYPKSKITTKVSLEFPIGGNVFKSIPEYGNGWDITVDETGLINSKYTYLFYESTQPNIWQDTLGWNIKQDSLESFFRKNLIEYGFKGHEIEDFIEYWIPLLKKNKYYSIYPQTNVIIDKAIILNILNKPDKILRLFYWVKGVNEKVEIKEPKIKTFKREGYYVTEWGVLL